MGWIQSFVTSPNPPFQCIHVYPWKIHEGHVYWRTSVAPKLVNAYATSITNTTCISAISSELEVKNRRIIWIISFFSFWNIISTRFRNVKPRQALLIDWLNTWIQILKLVLYMKSSVSLIHTCIMSMYLISTSNYIHMYSVYRT